MKKIAFEPNISVSGLPVRLPVQVAEVLLAETIKVYSKPSYPEHEKLREIIIANVKVREVTGGIEKARPGQVKRALEKVWFKNPVLAGAILDAWVSRNQKIKDACKAFLEQESPLNNRLAQEMRQSKGDPDPVILAEIVRTLEGNHPGIGTVEEIWLAAALALLDQMFLTSEPVFDEDPEMEEKTPTKSIEMEPIPTNEGWEGVLDLLRNIPPDDLRWQSFDLFLQAAGDIAGQKQEALRKQEQAQELAGIIERCRPLIVEQAAYFEIAGTEEWWQADVPVSRSQVAGQALEALYHQLEEFKCVKDSLSRSQRFQTEEQIVKAYEAVRDFFTAGQAAFPYETEDVAAAGVVLLENDKTPPSPEKNESIEQNEPQENEGKDSEGQKPALAEDQPAAEALDKKDSSEGTPIVELPVVVDKEAITALTAEASHSDPMKETPHSEEESFLAKAVSDITENELVAGDTVLGSTDPVEDEESPHNDYDEPAAQDTTYFVDETEEEEEPELEEDHEAGDMPPVLEEGGTPFVISDDPLPVVSEEQANEELLRRLSIHDLPSAYWLAWASEQLGRTPPFPSWLIAAMQGAIWSIGLWPEQATAFRESVSETVQSDLRTFETADHTGMFALAVGLHFNLIESTGRWASWLEVPLPAEFPRLAKMVDVIAENSHRGNVLDPLMVQLMWNREDVGHRTQELSDRVGLWLRQAGEKGARIIRAQKVWQEMVRPGRGQLYKWLDIVARNEGKKVGEVEAQLEVWSDRGKISLMIHQLDQQINGKRSRPIDGEARDQIIGWVGDICATAQEWCDTVGSLNNVQEGKEWAYDQVRKLSENLQELITQANAEISVAKESAQDPRMCLSFHLVDQVLQGIEAMISPNQARTLPGWPAISMLRQEDLNMRGQLVRSLLYYPELDLDLNGMPSLEQAAQVCSTIATYQNRTIEDAVQRWMGLHDYRFIDILLDQLQNSDLWETRVREGLRQDIQRLEHREIPETIVAIEQALLETIIAEGEHTEYNSRVESVRKQIRQSENNGARRISIRKLSNRLLEIREELKANRNKRLARQQKHWEELRHRLSEVAQDNESFFKIGAAFKAKIEDAVDKSFHEGDLRSAGEYLAHLEASIALPVPRLPEEAVFETIQDENPHYLADFIGRLPEYGQIFKPRVGLTWSQIITEVRNPNSTLLDIPTGSLPGPRRQEAASALESWRYLKSAQVEQEAKHLYHVSNIMQYLGFEVTSPSPVSVLGLPPGMRDYQLWRVSASAGVFAPVAQFGSQRKGYYQVLGVWNRPGMETLGAQVSALMQKTGDEPTVVFYFHILTIEQRRQLLSTTHHNKLPIIVIDEALLLHLARERENRLRVMFACTLPYTALNPYFPAAAGLVPPEVFKGRSDLVRELISPQGPMIIFGGRQLGKSALLRQVEREFHHPREGRFVLYEDIKLVGAVGADKDYQIDLRDRLAPKLIALGLLEPASVNEDIGKILLQIEQKVKNKHIQVRLLLDETDNFLNADALHNFSVVQKLKNVTEQTDHAFKFILAGLHNVQRFGRIPNHPLAHLGDPIQIGPLPPRPARDLLMEPLHALGFHFGSELSHEDTSLPLHILSYTNRHPGLIQYFGSALVKHLLEKHHQPIQPPLKITRADVEQVYRKKEVRDKICERFNLTLDLDPRYTAITLVMILEQWDDQNGFDRLYSSQQLRERSAAWWSEAFGEEAITPEGFKGILEEMVGLGVLAVSQDENSFRLRSPNLVYLMGTHEEIWDRMSRLSGTVPPGQSALNSHHARLQSLDFSPFTFGQERVLNNPRSGVALIFGSNASGLGNLEEALRRLPSAKNRYCPVRIAARGADAITQQLKQNVREHSETGLLISHREMQGDSEKMAEEVQAAIQYCTQVKDPTLRVCFTFDPQAAWQWFQLPMQEREQIEERALVMSLQCWDRIGVQQRLEMETSEGSEIMVSDRLLTRVVDATGGWMTLLDAYTTECRSKELGVALDLFQQAMRAKDNAVVKQFVADLSIYDRLPRELIDVLIDPQLKQMVKEEPSAFIDLLELVMKGKSQEVIKNAVEYLQRLWIIVSEPYPELDSVISRCWNAV